jgi:hypothetical protein
MKQPKEHLYILLSTDPGISALVDDRVYFQSYDQDQSSREERFPAITYFRISSLPPSKTTKRIDIFQITSRDLSNKTADHIADLIIKLLHHRKDNTMKNCFLTASRVDLYDKKSKVHGIALTFNIIMHETDY